MVRPAQNTDWKYVRFEIPLIENYVRGCTFYSARSLKTILDANRRYAIRKMSASLKIGGRDRVPSNLDRKEFFESRSDVVFCHDEFPRNADGIPMVWQNSILDPQMTLAYGASKETLEAEREWKRVGFSKADIVQVSSEAERDRLSEWFPENAHKFVAIPFFLPEVTEISDDDLAKKSAGETNCSACLLVTKRGGRDWSESMTRLPGCPNG